MSIVTPRRACDKCSGTGRVENDYGLAVECSGCEGVGIRCGIYDCDLPATHTARLRWPEGALGERMPLCSAHVRGDGIGAVEVLTAEAAA